MSPEEQDLERRALPYAGDTRLGHPAQARHYARWRYHPEAPHRRNPLARARSLEDLKAFPFPDPSAPYSELLYLSESEGLGFDRFEVRLHGTTLIAIIYGAPVTGWKKEIKAVTYHNLQILHSAGGFSVTIVFDV